MSNEDLEVRIDDLETRLDDAINLTKQSRQKVTKLRDELREKDEQIYEIKQRLETFQDCDQLVKEVASNAADTPTKRAIRLIQTLNNEATANRQAGREPTASLTNREAKKALGGGPSRSSVYRAMERVVELLNKDTNVIQYKKEPRSSRKKSRLVIDLDRGEAPQTIAGYQIRTPTVSDGGGE